MPPLAAGRTKFVIGEFWVRFRVVPESAVDENAGAVLATTVMSKLSVEASPAALLESESSTL